LNNPQLVHFTKGQESKSDIGWC